MLSNKVTRVKKTQMMTIVPLIKNTSIANRRNLNDARSIRDTFTCKGIPLFIPSPIQERAQDAKGQTSNATDRQTEDDSTHCLVQGCSFGGRHWPSMSATNLGYKKARQCIHGNPAARTKRTQTKKHLSPLVIAY